MKAILCLLLVLGASQAYNSQMAAQDKYGRGASGGWGGQYRCPSGKTYYVADNNDACRSLAGTNGRMLNCHRHQSSRWLHKVVDCANRGANLALSKRDKVRNGAPGGWGGMYLCPSGRKYAVADGNSACRRLNGSGGRMLNCIRRNGVWTGKAVSCASKSAYEAELKAKREAKQKAIAAALAKKKAAEAKAAAEKKAKEEAERKAAEAKAKAIAAKKAAEAKKKAAEAAAAKKAKEEAERKAKELAEKKRKAAEVAAAKKAAEEKR